MLAIFKVNRNDLPDSWLLGVLEFRNRVASFVMTDFARKRTEAVLDEIRRLQSDDN